MTAVEWLQEKYKQQGTILNVQFERAKEMEKDIITDAFNDGQWDYCTALINDNKIKEPEEYYNETFKSE